MLHVRGQYPLVWLSLNLFCLNVSPMKPINNSWKFSLSKFCVRKSHSSVSPSNICHMVESLNRALNWNTLKLDLPLLFMPRKWNMRAAMFWIHYTCILTYLHTCGRLNPHVYPLKYHSSHVPYFTSCLVCEAPVVLNSSHECW